MNFDFQPSKIHLTDAMPAGGTGMAVGDMVFNFKTSELTVLSAAGPMVVTSFSDDADRIKLWAEEMESRYKLRKLFVRLHKKNYIPKHEHSRKKFRC